MELLDGLTIGHGVTIYNVLGPIMLVALIFGIVLLHKPRNKPVRRDICRSDR